jgi:superfamily II DNA or RNA helicase/HKD family nuclease/SOS-response transcriptional repressor LexA
MSTFPVKHLTVGGNDPFLPSLLAAINHASEISITTAFIQMTGVRLIQDALVDALNRKVVVRILTGDYLGITDPYALRYFMLLQEQGAQVKVFTTKGKTSFHMKAYIFTCSVNGKHDEGCAFIGSSNISKTALLNGLEWNLRIDREEDESRFLTILKEYEILFNDARCQPLTHEWIDDYIKRIPIQSIKTIVESGQDEMELPPTPTPIQTEALAALANTRKEGYRRGLVVMATGLGKTWLAAFDSKQANAKRVLFVAHREEILNQAEETFVRIWPTVKVGRYNGKKRDVDVDMLFASVGTLGRAKHLDLFERDHFDYIVVDEFHHAAARTYQQLLAYFNPRFLLGLTATRERTDQSDILGLCDDNLVFDRDLFDGIEADLLCPFSYLGIADTVNYDEITWRNGRFDPNELTNQFATHARAQHNFQHWTLHHQTRTLAFCISKKHADFMADYFCSKGIKAVSVHSDSRVLRNEALLQLRQGELEVVFSVDLFNEGVDLPSIDTVLMLRPTESKIIFLQQLGRGLRNSPATGKEKLIILDFIGNHISFFRKPEALFKVGVSNKERKEFVKAVAQENLPLPSGCFVNYDLKSIGFMEQLIETRVGRQEEVYRALRNSYGRRPSLAEFYRAGGNVATVRQEYGQWLLFVSNETNESGVSDLGKEEQLCFSKYQTFFLALETTSLTKSFKLVLLEALLELDGFIKPIDTEKLALKSFEVLQRRRPLLHDLPKKYAELSELHDKQIIAWHTYWKGNPIKAWAGSNTEKSADFFMVKGGKFEFKLKIDDALYDTFITLAQELINYRFLQYEARPAKKPEAQVLAIPINKEDTQQIPYFSDLKIACGHFKSSEHEGDIVEHLAIPLNYGKLNPSRHFIARAAGDSMNGGKKPIIDGDYLLLELITPDNAGSNNGKTIAIERQDVSGDDQYLLRSVQKKTEGQYQLNAQNPSYEPMMATEDMVTFARLLYVIDPVDLHLHKQFMREEIPQLFGLTFNTGLWQSGHVCPKGSLDQYLLVTLNKQGKEQDHQYHDYFIDEQTLHWQSQKATTENSSKGKAITGHAQNGGRVYLFVRKNKLEFSKGAPFYYCGDVTYKKHESESPMNVEWELNRPLSKQLLEYFA